MSYQNILRYGTFYFPAYNHYGREVNVVCDRCQTQQLNACIGHMQQDLCLRCADELTKTNTTYIGFPTNPPIRPHPYYSRPQIDPHDYFRNYK